MEGRKGGSVSRKGDLPTRWRGCVCARALLLHICSGRCSNQPRDVTGGRAGSNEWVDRLVPSFRLSLDGEVYSSCVPI